MIFNSAGPIMAKPILAQALKMRVGRVLFFGLNAVILTSRNSIRASGGYTVSHIVIP